MQKRISLFVRHGLAVFKQVIFYLPDTGTSMPLADVGGVLVPGGEEKHFIFEKAQVPITLSQPGLLAPEKGP